MPTNAEGNFSGKRLVIFGCGFLGGWVADEALRRGVRVTALTRNVTQAGLLRARGIDVVVDELASDTWHAKIPVAADFVLVAVSGGSGDASAYRRSYIDGVESVLHWGESPQSTDGIGTLVYTSSTSVYAQDGGVWVDESQPAQPATERGRVLRQTEQLLLERPARTGAAHVLRLAGLYGPGRTHLLQQVQAGEVAGVPTHHLNLIHRDDAAAAIWACFAAGDGGEGRAARREVFNVADDTPTPKGEVVAWLAKRLGLPPPRFTGEAVSVRRGLTPDRLIANAKLRRTLAWRPRFPSFREGYENILSP